MTSSHPDALPLDDAARGFLAALRSGKPSPHTVKARTADLAIITEALGSFAGKDRSELLTTDLSVAALRAAFGQFADTHEKASVARAWSTWNRFCDHLVVDGVIPGNPMAAVAHPRSAKTIPSSFDEASVERLLHVLRQGQIPARHPWPRRDYAVITTLAVTGARASEFLSLTLGNVEGSPGQRQILIRKGKGDKSRAVPIAAQLEPILGDYLTERWHLFPRTRPYRHAQPGNPWTTAPPPTALWAGDTGATMTISQLEHLVRRAYKAAGVNSARQKGALIHALRHTFATRLVENGASAVEVMELLGHASLQTTQRYLTTRPDHLRAAIAANPVYGQI